uniref:hypothetical protein n=1 Tax=Trebonia sp. TaxID=2767075 RepID=UPI00260DC5DB
MTTPDEGLEQALRRALSAAVNQVEPGADGLQRIRARTAGREPQPWLLSVASEAVSRVWHFTWRGHWAWPESLARRGALAWQRLIALPWPRLRRLPQPTAAGETGPDLAEGGSRPGWWESVSKLREAGTTWLRPVAVLAGIAFIVGISFAIPP